MCHPPTVISPPAPPTLAFFSGYSCCPSISHLESILWGAFHPHLESILWEAFHSQPRKHPLGGFPWLPPPPQEAVKSWVKCPLGAVTPDL